MHYTKPDKPLNEEFVQDEIDQLEGRKIRDIAEMIVEMRLHESELYERYEKEHKRLINRYHE